MPRPFFQRTFDGWLAANKTRFERRPRITKRRRTHIEIAFAGITPKISGCITRDGASIAVEHKGECVDLLASFDIAERRTPDGRYFCELCLKPEFHASRQALWESHCFEQLLQWVSQHLRASGQWLHVRTGPGISFASIQPDGLLVADAAGPAEDAPRYAWPIDAPVHPSSQQPTSIMKKVIFYCHGYGSSSHSDKVRRIEAMGFEVIAHDIDLDPSVSLPQLDRVVEDWCVGYTGTEHVDLVFVGTSLGAWYANKLGHAFGSDTVLINPALDPAQSLGKYGVPEDILQKYAERGPVTFTEQDTVVIAANDEVLSFPNTPDWCRPARLLAYPSGGHRFNGPELEDALGRVLGIR